jgi:hypothetical protein
LRPPLMSNVRQLKVALIRLAALALLQLLGSTSTLASEQQAAFILGSYELVRTGSVGGLVLHHASSTEIVFSINVVSCMHSCETEAVVNHIASLERVVAHLRGSSAVYSESLAGTEPVSAPCTITLIRRSDRVLVKQDRECSAFGQGMSVHGEYRRKNSRAQRQPVA